MFEKMDVVFDQKPRKIKLVGELRREKTFPDGVEIRSARTWLRDFSI